MDRTYRASNGIYLYAAVLLVAAVVLAFEALQRFRSAASVPGVLLLILAAAWLLVAVALLSGTGRLRVVIRPDSIVMAGMGPTRRMAWTDVESVREIRGPAYELSLRDLLPGPFLPHGILRGETVLELIARPAMRMVFRRAIVESYGALQQDVLRSIPKDAEVDLHARWWKD
jgi:hypothetical protein